MVERIGEVVEKLKDLVGEDRVLTSMEERICYSYDATNQKFLPEAVVFPLSPQEISSILKLANEHKFPVVPRGAGSGFSGGSLPTKGGIVISLEKMNRIIEIDPENFTALVEPGVVNIDLQMAAGKYGLFFGPDPSSFRFCTIGGNIGECAGGPRAVKYGVTREHVLALEVVLPTGEIIHTGARPIKSVVGYDLTRLFVGSEGTLGIVTKALLRLLPLPEETQLLLAIFKKLYDAGKAVSSIMKGKILPSALEFMDIMSIRCVEESLNLGIPEEAEALLLIEIDGDKGSVERHVEEVKTICFQERALKVDVARDKREQKALWNIRRAISPALVRLKPYKINEDVAVPRSKIPEFIEGISEIGKKKNVIIANFGHAGDGNIHINVMVDNKDPDELKRGKEAIEEIFNLTLSLGGTLSGEHGIGIAKSAYIGMELEPSVIEIMKKIKDIFDPNNILNPGKVFG